MTQNPLVNAFLFQTILTILLDSTVMCAWTAVIGIGLSWVRFVLRFSALWFRILLESTFEDGQERGLVIIILFNFIINGKLYPLEHRMPKLLFSIWISGKNSFSKKVMSLLDRFFQIILENLSQLQIVAQMSAKS